MAHTYSNLVTHCVFSTKERKKQIRAEVEADLWAYMGGIARANKIKPIAIGGVEDHAHILISVPASMDVSRAVQLIKGGSSKWFREKHLCDFAWQQGFGAFSVSASQVTKTMAYIANQKAHHLKMDFKAEFITLLKKHGVEYDERYVWG